MTSVGQACYVFNGGGETRPICNIFPSVRDPPCARQRSGRCPGGRFPRRSRPNRSWAEISTATAFRTPPRLTMASLHSILLGDGSGALNPANAYDLPATADFNGDGNLDLAIAAGGGASVDGLYVLLGVGDGTSQPPVKYAAGSAPVALAAGDSMTMAFLTWQSPTRDPDRFPFCSA
jgi:hypothetical protein